MPDLFEPPRYIAVEGPIRVGKSTLARILAERMAARRVLEPEDNPHLEAFYSGESGAGFLAQMHFLAQRYAQLRELGPRRPPEPVVADYIFEKDKLFAYINLSDSELTVYEHYYRMFRPELCTPDLVIYLQATPEVLKRRVAKRNVPAEHAISDEYLEEVVKAYDHFFFHYSLSDLLVINTTEIDFVEKHQDLRELLRRISEPFKGTQYFLPLGQNE
jgi:deoxyadenosine/deoxycytidine kinase